MLDNISLDTDRKSNGSRSNLIISGESQLPEEEFTIRVLTLNCWGLWLGAKKRGQRIAGIVRYLRENSCDIVFLQEVWVTSDFETIRDGTKDIYRFAHLFRSGSVLGSSGIVILCKWLPRVIHFEPYSLNGSPFYPWHGDWFAGKGIAYSRVDFDGLSLHLFSTHTHAYYKENEPVHDQYSVHRVCQSYQLARFITFIRDTACNRKSNGKDLLIVAGDMNSTSSELPYKVLTTMAGLTDCFKASRYNNPSSNIIHRHKLLGYKKRMDCGSASAGSSAGTDDRGSTSLNNSGVSFLHSKFGDNLLLETIEGCRSKIAQVFFDSDTDDEDITYCHPRNSFTPSWMLDFKAFKFSKKSKSRDNITFPDKMMGDDDCGGANSGNNNDILDSNRSDNNTISNNNNSSSKLDRNSSDHSSTGQSYIVEESSRQVTMKRNKKSPMKRIDFILCSLLTHGHCVVDRIATESKDPSLNCSLSDHEPVMVELKISDVSHDLMEKNRIVNDSRIASNYSSSDYHNDKNSVGATSYTNTNGGGASKRNSVVEYGSRPLASVVDSDVSPRDASQIEETTNQWVSEKEPVNLQLSYQECNIQVMEETQDLLRQYHEYNRASKTQLFYITLLMFVITLPTSTYYALSNELIPISTVIFMWFASSFIFAIGLLIGFLSYRFEQGAIEAILNDITCKILVAKDRQRYNQKI